ncbi:hypothetical protein GCM10027456_01160 [Kineosporia babensis]
MLAWAGGAVVLVLLAVAGLAALGDRPVGGQTEAADPAAPFHEAVSALKEAEGLGLSAPGFNVRMSRQGDLIGTQVALPLKIARIDGATYLQGRSLEVSQLIPGLDYSDIEAQTWLRTEDFTGLGLSADAALPESPKAFAEQIEQVLAEKTTNFSPSPYGGDEFSDLYTGTSPDENATNTVMKMNDVEVYAASTVHGRLYVTKAAPHRLVQVSTGFLGLKTPAAEPTTQGTAAGASSARAAFASMYIPTVREYNGVSLQEMNAEQVRKSYGDLAATVPELQTVVDTRYQVTGHPTGDCTAKSCVIKAKAKAQVRASAGVKGADPLWLGINGKFMIDYDRDRPVTCLGLTETVPDEFTALSCTTKDGAEYYQELAQQDGAGSVSVRTEGWVAAYSRLDVDKTVSALQQRQAELN